MTDVLLPGGRDVRGTLDEPDGDPAAIVVGCPPHPQQGGSRSDRRLVAVGDALREAGIACLRFDYGAWDEGYGEREDVRNAVRWADDRYGRGGKGLPIGVFGYSFGATLALLAAASVDREIAAVAALAPTARLADDLDAVAALETLEGRDREGGIAVRILYGERDTTADWEPVVERVRDGERGARTDVVSLSADHFFVGQQGTIADAVRAFFDRTLLEGR